MHQVSPTIYFGMHWSERLRVAPVFELSEAQEAELTRLARSVRSSVRVSLRARIVLLAAQGLQNKDIAQALGVGRVQVARWRERYLQFGLEGIERDLPRGAPVGWRQLPWPASVGSMGSEHCSVPHPAALFLGVPAAPDPHSRAMARIAVGMPIAGHPPHRSGHAQFTHPAPTLGV